LRGVMSKPRVAAVLVLAGAIVGWTTKVAWERGLERGTEAEKIVADRAVATAARAEVMPAGRVVHFWGAEPVAVEALVAQPAQELGVEGTGMVAEIVALQALARDTELELSPRQWTAFAAATTHIQAVRQAYEASIARVATREPGRFQVEVPAYPAAGDALRAKFHAELREQIGENTAAEILAQMGRALEGHFAGFGVGVQTLEFAGASGGAANDYRVTRTVRFWNAVEGGERLTTRRETHFPRTEDPSGETWGPFLAALSAAGSAGGE